MAHKQPEEPTEDSVEVNVRFAMDNRRVEWLSARK